MNGTAAGALDAGTERDEEIREVDDFGFPGGVLQHGFTVGEHSRHQKVLGAGDRHRIEDNVPALQPVGPGLDEAVLHYDAGAERLQAGDVEIDGTSADRAATRQRDVGLPESRDQRSEHQDRRAHRLDEFIGRGAVGHFARVDLDIQPVVDRDLHSQGLQQGD